MFLPEQFVWLEPVIIAATVVFLVDLIGNSIAYRGRFINALVTAVVFLIIFAAMSYFGIGKMEVSTSIAEMPSQFLPDEFLWLEPVLVGTVLVLVIGFVANIVAFKNRFLNALVTALIFLAIFAAVTYFGYGSVDVELPSVSVGQLSSPE